MTSTTPILPPAPIDLFRLPSIVIHDIVKHAVLSAGFQKSMKLRLVCRYFDTEVRRLALGPHSLDLSVCKDVRDMSFPMMRHLLYEHVRARGRKNSFLSSIESALDQTMCFSGTTDHETRLKYLSALCASVTLRFTRGEVIAKIKQQDTESSTRTTENPILLEIAAAIGDTSLVQSLLKAGASPDRNHTIFGWPLQIAALLGHTHIVSALLESGATPRAGSRAARWRVGLEGTTTPLCLAAYAGHAEVVEILLQSRESQGDIQNALLLSIAWKRNQAFDILVTHATMIVQESQSGTFSGYWICPFLRQAANYGNTYAVAHILRTLGRHDGSTCDRITCRACREGSIALVKAAGKGHDEIVKLLLCHGVVDGGEISWTCTAVDAAITSGHSSTLLLLIEGGVKLGLSYVRKLEKTIDNDDYESFPFLMMVGSINQNQNTWYKQCREYALCYAAKRGRLRFVRHLLELGTDPDGTGFIPRLNNSAIRAASQMSHEHAISLLLEFGARDSRDSHAVANDK